MLCAIFKSHKKIDTYLYVKDRNDLSPVPETLKTMFGKPEFVMLFDLKGKKKLAIADNARVMEQINEQGFYLQMPPKVESLLTQHKQQMKGE